MSSLQSRVLVAIIGVPVLVWVVLWAPSIVMMAALALLAGIAAHELTRCVGVEKTSFLHIWSVIAAAFSVEWYYDRPDYVAIWWIIYVVAAFIYAIVKAGEVKFVQTLAGIFAVVAIPYSFAAFLRMQAAGIHLAHRLRPVILSFACDTSA